MNDESNDIDPNDRDEWDYDDPDQYAECDICGSTTHWETCWACQGDGGHHDCGEDCCPCLHPELDLVACDECEGEGGYQVCEGLPHTDEQMAEHRKRQEESDHD